MRGDRYSEVNKAAKVAEKASLKHHVKIISKQEFWDALPDVMYHMDEPLGDASAVALYFPVSYTHLTLPTNREV